MCFSMNNKLTNASGKILDLQNNKNNKRLCYYVNKYMIFVTKNYIVKGWEVIIFHNIFLNRVSFIFLLYFPLSYICLL